MNILRAPSESSFQSLTLGFGKHADETYAHVMTSRPDYCRWILRNCGPERSKALRDFADFLRTNIQDAAAPATTSAAKSAQPQTTGTAATQEQNDSLCVLVPIPQSNQILKTMSHLSSECNAVSTEKGQGRKRPRKDSAGARRSPLVAPYSLQLHAAGELVYRARLFAVKLYNQMCPPYLNLKLPTRPCRHHRFFVPAYGLSLKNEERLRVTGCGLMAMFVLRLTHGINCPAKTRRLIRVEGVVQHVAAVRAAAANEALFQQAQQLYAVGKYAATVAKYQEASANDHAPSHAELAWLLLSGREDVRVNEQKAFELAEKGASMDCMHSRGVLAFMYHRGCYKGRAKGSHQHSASQVGFVLERNVSQSQHFVAIFAPSFYFSRQRSAGKPHIRRRNRLQSVL
jgi:hypothetical protein